MTLRAAALLFIAACSEEPRGALFDAGGVAADGSGFDASTDDAGLDGNDKDAATKDAGSDGGGADAAEEDASSDGGGMDAAMEDAGVDAGVIDAGPYWSPRAPVVSVDYYGIDGVDASHVWAVGTGGAIHHFNGTSWVEQRSGSETFTAVAAADASNVYVVGLGGLRGCSSDGGVTWSITTSSTGADLYTVVVDPAAGMVYVAGDAGVVEAAPLSCAAWTQLSDLTLSLIDFRDSAVGSPTNAIAVGANRQAMDDWDVWYQIGPGTGTWNAVWTNDENAALHTTVVFGSWPSAFFTERDFSGEYVWYSVDIHSVGPPAFYDIWGQDPTQLVVVGDDSTILIGGPRHYFPAPPAIAPVSLRGVWGSSMDDVWVVGFGGTVLHHP